ncbi:MAG: SRPBCC domain-containing protein [Planctomycetota bacterium]
MHDAAPRRRDLDPAAPALRLSVEVPAEPARVWAAWTTSAGFEGFFGVPCWIELEPGGAYELYFDGEQPLGARGSEGCRVLSYLPERMLSFSWNAPPDFGELRGQHTWVVLELEPLGPGTRVSLTQLGWGVGGRWPELQAYFERAWGMVLATLRGHFAG